MASRGRAGLRADGHSLRDTLSVHGTIRLGSRRKTGQLDLIVTDQAIGGQADWRGMSGAAVFVHDFLVGVVARAAPTGNELVAVPVAAALGEHPVRLAEFTSSAAERQRARDVLDRLGLSTQLSSARRRPYLDTITELAADCRDLRGREQELRHLRSWLQSRTPYGLWTGMPWAGKTALAARLAADPPPDVDVVCFFASSARGANLGRLWQSVTDQLAALVHQSAPFDGNAAFDELWRQATQASRDAGRTLLLLIDGVDELQDRRSVTELLTRLPHQPPAGAHILLFTRSHPDLENAVPGAHPLRSGECDRVDLDPSPEARHLRKRARIDLETVLDEGGAALRALLLIARVGPMSEPDIRQAIGWPDAATDQGALHRALTSGPSGRMLRRDSVRQGRARFIIGHDTLRAGLLERADPGVAETDLHRLLTLADTFAARDWPDNTPDFLLEGYPLLLAQGGDTSRLTATILSPRWQELAQARTRTALTAAATLQDALATMLTDPPVDLAAMLLLAGHLAEINPPRHQHDDWLIEAWALVGELEYAEHLASRLASAAERAAAFAALTDQALDQLDRDRAVGLIDRALAAVRDMAAIPGAPDQVSLLLRLQRLARRLGRISAAAEFGNGAWALLPLLPADQHPEPWLNAAENAATEGDIERIRTIVAIMSKQPLYAEARRQLAVAAAAAGDAELAAVLQNAPSHSGPLPSADPSPEPLPDELTATSSADESRADPRKPARPRPPDEPLARIRSLIRQGDYAQAAELIGRYQPQSATILDVLDAGTLQITSAAAEAAEAGGRAAIPVVAAAQSYVHRHDISAELEWDCRVGGGTFGANDALTEPAGTFLADITEVAASHGQLADVLRLAPVNAHPAARTSEFSAFALGATRAGHADTAARLLAAIRSHSEGSNYAACYQIARCWAETDQWREAVDLVRDYRATFEPSIVRATAALTAIRQGDLPDGLSILMECISAPGLAFDADDLLASAAIAAAETDHWILAAKLAADVESVLRLVQLQADLAATAQQAGDPDLAKLIIDDAFADAATLTEPAEHSAALAAIAVAVLASGEPASARKILFRAARALADVPPDDQAPGLLDLAEDAYETGDGDLGQSLLRQAAAAARRIADQYQQADHLAAVAVAAYRSGATELAAPLVSDLASRSPAVIPGTVADLVAAAAQAGDTAAATTTLTVIKTSPPNSIAPPGVRESEHLSQIAATAARAGLWREADEALAALPSEHRINALAELASIVSAEHPRRARQWIAEGLVLGVTPRLLAAAARLEPSLAPAAASILLARSRALLPPTPTAQH